MAREPDWSILRIADFLTTGVQHGSADSAEPVVHPGHGRLHGPGSRLEIASLVSEERTTSFFAEASREDLNKSAMEVLSSSGSVEKSCTS